MYPNEANRICVFVLICQRPLTRLSAARNRLCRNQFIASTLNTFSGWVGSWVVIALSVETEQ